MDLQMDIYIYRTAGEKCEKPTTMSNFERRDIEGTCHTPIASSIVSQRDECTADNSIDNDELNSSNERLSPDKLRSIQSQPNTFIIDLQHQQQK